MHLHRANTAQEELLSETNKTYLKVANELKEHKELLFNGRAFCMKLKIRNDTLNAQNNTLSAACIQVAPTGPCHLPSAV